MTRICDCRTSEMRIALPTEAYDKKSWRGAEVRGHAEVRGARAGDARRCPGGRAEVPRRARRLCAPRSVRG
jgi:hypothetical protein